MCFNLNYEINFSSEETIEVKLATGTSGESWEANMARKERVLVQG